MDLIKGVEVVTVQNTIENGIKDIEGNIEDIMYFYDRTFANLVTEMGFEVELVGFSNAGVCSNYF